MAKLTVKKVGTHLKKRWYLYVLAFIGIGVGRKYLRENKGDEAGE